MIEKTFHSLSATQLRIVLMASIGVITLIGGVGFYFIEQQLHVYAVQVSHISEDASTSDNDITTLQNLQKKLADSTDSIKRTESIVADSKFYQYQDQIIHDLNTYANRAGVTISSFVFDSNTGGKIGAPTTTGQAGTSISGLKSTTVSITLKTPTKYKNLMNFVHYVEQNLTKMQIANVSLTKGTNADEVSTNALLIEVYTK